MSVIKVRRKKSHRWAYVFRYRGKTYKREGFPTKTEASEAEAILKAKLKGVPYQPERLSVGQLVDRYMVECQTIMGLTHNTVRQKGFVFNTLLEFLGTDKPADMLTKDNIKDYLRFRAEMSGNIMANRDKRDIAAMYNWADKEELIDCQPPCKGIPDFPQEPTIRYTPPKEDVLAVKMKADRDQRDFLDCIHFLIGRRQEIWKLRWEDVHFQTGWVDLYTKKGGKLRRMPKPINDEVRSVLERRRERAKKNDVFVFDFTKRDFETMMPKLCEGAGVKPFGLHALRHYAASDLLAKGYSIKEIQFLLGHEKAATTEGYLHIQTGDFHRIVNSLSEKVLRSVTLKGEEK